ncbi:hypothetical protein JTB14_013430 [Gonioctena quinquepunctata]|nr:hypothetical protein JTB14_013430 [Gonioctena quinquepunctata]
MGSNVLETKSPDRAGTNIYAHCTRKQNSFVRRGAMTVMIVNDNEETYNVKVKLGTTPPEKTMEVQTYILTAPALNSTQILLNGKELTPDILQEKNPFVPKIRRAKTSSHIELSVPARSVGFFVLPGARVPACIDQEKETELLLEEMEENQNIPLSEEVALKFGSRSSFVKNHLLDEITQKMKQEMMSDEKYYSNPSLRARIDDHRDKEKEVITVGKLDEKGRKQFIDRVKLAGKQKKNIDFEKKRDALKKFLSERTKLVKAEPKVEARTKELDLSSTEVERILKDRARARAARRNIVFTDDELRALVRKASKKFYNSRIKRSIPTENKEKRDINVRMLERTIHLQPFERRVDEDYAHIDRTYEHQSKSIRKRSLRKTRDINDMQFDYGSKLATSRSKWEDKKDKILGNTQTLKEKIKERIRNMKDKGNNRFKRDINMELLEVKSKGGNKSDKKNKQKKEMAATMRDPGQTDSEFLERMELEAVEEEQPKTEIFAELAESEDLEEEELLKPTQKSKKPKLFDKKTKLYPFAITNPSIEFIDPPRRSKKGKKKSKSEDNLQFLTSSEEFTDIEDDFPCIHEFFGADLESDREKKPKDLTPEIGELPSNENQKKKKSKTRKTKTFSEETSSEEERRRRKRSFHMRPYKSNEPTEIVDRLQQMEYLLEEMESKGSEYEGNNSTDKNPKHVVVIMQNDDEYLGRPKRSSYLENNHQEPTGFLNRVKRLEGKMEDVEKYKKGQMHEEQATSQAGVLQSDISLNDNAEVSKERLKREDNLAGGTDLLEITENDFRGYKKDMKKHFKDLKHMIEEDKLRFEEKKRQNQMRLLQMKKKQELALAKEAEEVISRVQENETESENNLLENLRTIKENLEHKKEEFDELLMEDLKISNEEKKDEIITKMNFGNKKILNNMNKDSGNHTDGKQTVGKKFYFKESKKVYIDKNLGNSPTDEDGDTVKVVKRSIFDSNNIFGNYQPITPGLRMWKPSDIFSLRKDYINLINPNKLIPPNDLYAFRNIFDQNKLLTLRKRSIDDSMGDRENEIDSDFNAIRKESGYSRPNLNLKNGDYKFLLPNNDEFEVSANDGVTEMKFLHHEENVKPKLHEDIRVSLVSKDFGDGLMEGSKKKDEPKETHDSISHSTKKDVHVFGKEDPKDAALTEDSLFSYFFKKDPSEERDEDHDLEGKKVMSSHSEHEYDFVPLSRSRLKIGKHGGPLFSLLFEDDSSQEIDSKEIMKPHDDLIRVVEDGEPKDFLQDPWLSNIFNNIPLKEKIENNDSEEVRETNHSRLKHGSDQVSGKDEPKGDAVTGHSSVPNTMKYNSLKAINHSEEESRNCSNLQSKTDGNIQVIPLKQEKVVFDDLIGTLTGFFSKITNQIQTLGNIWG